ncbi:hypothetical protein, partial [Klebsiella pneumoniae]|uniref:hypothetical protein n=1 Tax=Klebsiella pneumoniae TaxID=573 RepID=UPI00272FA868
FPNARVTPHPVKNSDSQTKGCDLFGSQCERPSYILSFNYYAKEIYETKKPLIYKPLAQGQIVPEML